MRILITGGTGLIGGHLTRSLVEDGNPVVLLSRNPKPAHDQFIQSVKWDGANIPADAVGHIDAVVNLAGAGIADHRWTAEYKQEILNSRILATQACVRFIREATHKPSVFLSASAVGFYGTKNPHTVDESAPPGTDFLARTGMRWEESAQGADIRTVIARIGLVMAKEGGAFPRLLQPFKFYAGGYLGDGKQGFPWIHIRDVVGIMRWAIENPKVHGAVNLVAPEVLTNRQFAYILGKLTGKPSSIPVPAFAVKTMMGESAMLLLEGQFVRPEKALSLGYTFHYPKAEAALKALLEK